jgi:hypothetical protein
MAKAIRALKKTDKPPTHKVEKEPFKVELSLKGYFDANEVEELCLRPEAFTPHSITGVCRLELPRYNRPGV